MRIARLASDIFRREPLSQQLLLLVRGASRVSSGHDMSRIVVGGGTSQECWIKYYILRRILEGVFQCRLSLWAGIAQYRFIFSLALTQNYLSFFFQGYLSFSSGLF